MWRSEGKCGWNICLNYYYYYRVNLGPVKGCREVFRFYTQTYLPELNEIHQVFLSSNTQKAIHTHMLTSQKYGIPAQCHLQSCFKYCPPVTTCAVRIAATHSQSWDTSKGLFAPIAFGSLTSDQSLLSRAVDCFWANIPQQNAFYGKTNTLQENRDAPQSSETNTQT